MKILYIEDVEMNAKLLKLLIERLWDISINIAGTAEEGLAMMQGSVFNLIYMDVNLPKMSGIEAVIEIRKSHSKDDLPIIMVSADANEDIIEQSNDAGANDYITKPINIDDLQEKTNRYLNLPKPI